ncbi:MAG TPA: hypothetical protein VFC31_02595 [Candidatus Limnocylindria bacterium]|nr:hypothetical protein [Candidatus Limnocylindria bacterium]
MDDLVDGIGDVLVRARTLARTPRLFAARGRPEESRREIAALVLEAARDRRELDRLGFLLHRALFSRPGRHR